MASVHLRHYHALSAPISRRRVVLPPPAFACPRRRGVHPRFPGLPANSGQCARCSRVSCAASSGGCSAQWPGSSGAGDFVEAVLLVDDIMRHRHLRRQRLFVKPNRRFSAGSIRLPTLAQGRRANTSYMSDEFLQQFKNPTLFLKVFNDEDLLLPIIVGESAIEQLIEAVSLVDKMVCPDEFQFTENLVQFIGNELKMVLITEKVANTYYASMYVGKAGEMSIINLDARPSHAINLATRIKAPIYVSKQIILADALRFSHGKRGGYQRKCAYDVQQDSAPDGPDILLEELDLLEKMKKAVQDERYEDAAMWRDRLADLCRSI